MKYIILIFVSFFHLDMARAEESISVRSIELQLQKMAKLNGPRNLLPPRAQIPFQATAIEAAKSSPLSCDITLAPSNKKIEMDYSCDAIKTIKSETLAIASN